MSWHLVMPSWLPRFCVRERHSSRHMSWPSPSPQRHPMLPWQVRPARVVAQELQVRDPASTPPAPGAARRARAWRADWKPPRSTSMTRDQLEPAKPLKPNGIHRRSDRDASVDDELQRPCRGSATAATQLGAGEPSSSVCHSGGSGSIGYISSRTSSSAPGSINRLPWLVVAGKRPSRTQRRTVPGLLPTL